MPSCGAGERTSSRASPTVGTDRSFCSTTRETRLCAGTSFRGGSASGKVQPWTQERTKSRSRRSRSRTRVWTAPEMDAATTDDGVVVDIVFEDGVFYLELANLADRPALNVACSFDSPLVD